MAEQSEAPRLPKDHRATSISVANKRNNVSLPAGVAQMSVKGDVVPKVVALFSVASVILAIVLAHRSPAAGYELSIYTSTPFPVLWLLLLSVAGGVGIVVRDLFTYRYQESRTYLIGFAVILLGATAFLCLPLIRNYVAPSGGDQLAHVGYVKDILLTGHFSDWNPYPVAHTLLAQITSITGLSALQVVNLNTALVVPIFMAMAYLLATAVLPNEGQRLLVALVAGGTIAGIRTYYLLPNTWSVLMLPLFFCCYFRQDRIPFRILLVALLVVYPFFHPLSSVAIMMALALIELPKPVYSRLLRRLGMGIPSWIESRPLVWPLLLEAAVFFPWVLTRHMYHVNISIFWEQLVTFGSSQTYQSDIGKLDKANVQGLGIPVLMLKMYGEVLLFLILAGLGATLLVKQLRSGIRDIGKYRLLLFSLWILPALLLFALDFVGVAGARVIAGDRMLLYIETACIPFVAFVLWEVGRRMRFSRLALAGTCSLVIVALVLNFYAHYRSPYLLRPNEQVTHTDMAGMTWYLDEKDPSLIALCVATDPQWYSKAILGIKATYQRADLPEYPQLENHFGYDNSTTIAEQYDGDRYVCITRTDRVVYQTVWKNLGRWVDADFRKLEQDPTVDRIYSNGATDILFVSQISEP
jgi:hypothetical protein